MMLVSRALAACLFVFAAHSLPVEGAMYKWTDEHGRTHYGDSVPPKYANRAGERMSKAGAQPAKAEAPKAVAEPVSAEEAEKQKVEAKRQLDRQRQDTALLSTYANESEIELARSRELKRNQDALTTATAGLARSNVPEDRRKLDAIMAQSKQQTDTINARFDAHIARYRELKGPVAATAATAQATPVK